MGAVFWSGYVPLNLQAAYGEVLDYRIFSVHCSPHFLAFPYFWNFGFFEVTSHGPLFIPVLYLLYLSYRCDRSVVVPRGGWGLDRVPSLTADVYPGRPIPANHDRRPDPSPVLLPFPAHRQGAMVGAMATQDAPGNAIHAGDDVHTMPTSAGTHARDRRTA
jgi:hypothetical protein